MKSILVLLIFVFITACSSAETSKDIPDRFKDFMSQYFQGYNYEYKDTNARGNKNYGEQYALFKIKKTDLKKSEIEEIYDKLQGGGWRLVETNHKNYSNFCYGENFSLIILYPLGKYEKTPSGIPLNYDDMSAWHISVYKSTTKLAACNQDSNDFIDFTKL
ncbi:MULTISPECIES: hypothetical protein [Acinetobacter]|uniref:hypothetical protein n=1 Tax=Acinetobacter TaxID=469 RepID=UPI000AED07A6|nr:MULTISPECIES: hypothetical protein [Acinetobacter]